VKSALKSSLKRRSIKVAHRLERRNTIRAAYVALPSGKRYDSEALMPIALDDSDEITDRD
jgi:hypothetical protein